METRPKAIILLGPPGSGKDTQALILAKEFGYFILTTGDLFRAEIAQQTPLGKSIKGIVERGELVPSATVNNVINQELARHQKIIQSTGIIFNGYPRLPDEVTHAERHLNRHKLTPLLAIYLDVDDQELLKRLVARASAEQRKDDTPQVAGHRIEVYKKETAPILDHYQKQGTLLRVDGNPPISNVSQSLLQAVREWHP